MTFSWRYSLVAFAKVLDQFSGIERYSGTTVELHLQKFWISLAESSVMMALEQRFGRPDGVESTLERCWEQPCGAKLAVEWHLGRPWCQVGPGTAFWKVCWRQVGSGTRPRC